MLRQFTSDIHKIDETIGLTAILPYQLGYISGLQEIYARRVGLLGPIPSELGDLHELRVLSMGNNRLSGSLPVTLSKLTNMQRIVLHQNKLSGKIPESLIEMGCIINVAGNKKLEYGEDVPEEERNALIDFFRGTKGATSWISK
jgi:Leucine-rich repeat (LRR) protein